MNPSKVIDLLPPHLQDISDNIYHSHLPEWIKIKMMTHMIRSFSRFCMSVGEGNVESNHAFFFYNILWARQHGRLTFDPKDRVSKRIFLKYLQQTLLGSEIDHSSTLNSALDLYGAIVLKGVDLRNYRL